MTIAIVVDECASRSPVLGGVKQASLFGHVRECAVTIVAIENILPPVGNEQIFESVVIVIPDTDTAGPTRMDQPCTLGNISKGTVAIVAIQAGAGFFALLRDSETSQ